MNQFKRAQVVMLPTKKNSSNIAKSINQDILSKTEILSSGRPLSNFSFDTTIKTPKALIVANE